jgi:arylsulfatase A-like enzyme
MTERRILVVAVDGLRASALGAYGNTAYGTPALDELAAESFLFDSCFAPAVELPAIYRALWQSLHPLRPSEYAADTGQASGTPWTLPNALSERGYQSTLVTDAADVAALGAAAGFGECIQISGDVDVRANDVSQTEMARLFSDASDIVAAPGGTPQLVWIHARGMYGPWDAPLELQRMLLDEGDPPPVETIKPPDLAIAGGDDPDTTFRYSVAYAAQVIVLDACWEALRDAMAAGGGGEWLVMLIGVRGFPLGEHRRVGGIDPRLYAEQLHVPWMLQFPDGAGRLARSGRLVSPLDLLPTLLAWVEHDAEKSTARGDGCSALPLVQPTNFPWRDALLSTSETGERAIRTPGWSLRCDERALSGELFVRPDDRWEANDVSALRREVVEGLIVAVEDASARIRGGAAMPEEPLAEELRRSVD